MTTHKIELSWFEPEIQNEMKNYICNICKGILYKPVLLKCGHIYCKECYLANRSNCINKECKNSSIVCENLPFISNILYNKKVLCKNEGCKLSINVNEIFLHFLECPKEQVNCKYKCGFSGLREKIVDHENNCEFRKILCKNCSMEISFKDEIKHKQECLMELIECNLCKEKIFRKDKELHLKNECKNIGRDCLFKLLGCDEKYTIKEKDKHMEEYKKKHQQSFINFIIDVKKNIELNEDKFNILYNDIKKIYNQAMDIYNSNKKFITQEFEEGSSNFNKDKKFNYDTFEEKDFLEKKKKKRGRKKKKIYAKKKRHLTGTDDEEYENYDDDEDGSYYINGI